MMLKICNNKNCGFSLLEILIVMVILAIIVSIAIPTYSREIIKTRRSDAQTALLNLAALMEHYYLEHHSYLGASIGNHSTISLAKISAHGYYKLSITTPTAVTYQLTATPINTQSNDTQCRAFSIDQAGVKSVSGTASVEQCWQ